MNISARLVQCNDNDLAPYKERIIEIAKLSYKSIPTEEIVVRFKKYHQVVLVFKDDSLVGFMFLTQHSTKNFHYIGMRFTAYLPEFQKSGLSKSGTKILAKLLLKYLAKKIVTLDRRPILYFCRVCNPFAYTSVHFMGNHAGGEVFPDLVRISASSLPEKTRSIYEGFRDDIGFKDIDVETGIIKRGAVDSGIITHKGVPSRMKFWKTPWHDYVEDGDELVMTVPVNYLFPLAWIFRGVAMVAKRITG